MKPFDELTQLGRIRRMRQLATVALKRYGVDEALQKQVDTDWQELNAKCPSRAQGCGGKPPLEAHPELLAT